ncbi:replication restart DNA helicase PriA [Ferrimonas sediminum]|uniref:Replication restart protein PriA n=1 Tax=Ferrimonas sediminum TaxID=718193 RepID=A0A1G8K484_9GAMM|nr:primosomal protein N' [Ferrimonas sediminum]SDI38252.1 replication restart DNA helicase PriA [Ferrimonas sediminum]
MYIQVALPVPLRQLFSYLPATDHPLPQPGCRVEVPFGRQSMVGVVVATSEHSDLPDSKLKPIERVLDPTPVLDDTLWQLSRLAARYYCSPIGMVLNQLLPVKLRQGESARPQPIKLWQLTDTGRSTDLDSLKRAFQQQRLLAYLQTQTRIADSDVSKLEFSRQALKALADKGLIEAGEQALSFDTDWQQQLTLGETPQVLNREQAVAVASISGDLGHFGAYLLEGVTGSGKTEVYLHLMEPILRAGKTVLVLVPEIGLTPQTIERFQRRFPVPVGVLHSAMNDNERLQVWQQAQAGALGIVIGTRSALFTAMPKLGMIIIDEEHDASFKQQEGFRYHGRDLAVMRAQLQQVPIILGSATPSMESLYNVANGKYKRLQLTARAGVAQHVKQRIVDLRLQNLDAGLSKQLLEKMEQHLSAGNQVMLFLNRRGFAPALLCHECGHLHGCSRCDAFYTVHQGSGMVQCHHCGSQKRLPRQCHECGSTQLFTQGVGTEQLEQALVQRYPQYPVVRIDRDTTSRKGSLNQLLEKIRRGEARILIGTQMLAKGHHFPDVTLVGLLDVDGALFSADFRASERLAQLYIQVAGRAGRASKPGEVILQTHQPEHPLLHQLTTQGYGPFADTALKERMDAMLPPAGQMAIIRAEATYANQAQQFLNEANHCFDALPIQRVGPMPAPMERKAGKFRYHTLLLANDRKHLQQALEQALPRIEQLPSAKRCRWHLERDPQDLL